MPFTALINGNKCWSSMFSIDTWNKLKFQNKNGDIDVVMKCCNKPGHLKTNQSGTRLFAHNPSFTCDREHESEEHLKCKQIIADLFSNDKRFIVDPERNYNYFTTDMYFKDLRVDFEICHEYQISYISVSELIKRDRNYKDNNILVIWILKEMQSMYELYVNHGILCTKLNDNYEVYLPYCKEYYALHYLCWKGTIRKFVRYLEKHTKKTHRIYEEKLYPLDEEVNYGGVRYESNT